MNDIFKITKGNRARYTLAILSIGLATLISMIEPTIIKITIDSIIGDKELYVPKILKNFIAQIGGRSALKENLWICAGCIVLLTSVRGIFLYFKGKFSGEASENMARNMRIKLYDHIQRLPYKYHVSVESGDLIQRCTSDVETVRKFFAVELVEIGRTFFIVLFAAIIMLSLDKKMTIISVITIPVIFLVSFIFFNNIRRLFEKSDAEEASLTAMIERNIEGVRVVKAFGREQFEVERFDEKNKKYRDLSFNLNKSLSTYWATSDLICTIQIGMVLMFGIYFAVKGDISLGTAVAFNTYESMLLWPIRQLGRILSDMGKMTVSIKRIMNIINEEEEKEEGKALEPEIKGDITFENVCFEYEKDKTVINDFSLKVNKGETVAVVGPTGAGKSSLVHLLLRLYDYKCGSIKIDGVKLSDISRKWIRKNIGIVLQEPFLYSRTIKDNIKMAKGDADKSEIISAASTAAVHKVIKSFEKGYDTIVGEKGVALSGGQRQRVAIARTLLNKFPILIFDDSLSAVDTETDKVIRNKLKNRNKDVTTFIISHRISTVMDADKIVVLKDGKIEAVGKHEELIKVKGIYKTIWEIQNTLVDVKDKKLA